MLISTENASQKIARGFDPCARRRASIRCCSLVSGTGPGSLDCAIQIASDHEGVFATVGIHPTKRSWQNQPTSTSSPHSRNTQKLSAGVKSASTIFTITRRGCAEVRFCPSNGTRPRRQATHHHPLPSYRQHRERLDDTLTMIGSNGVHWTRRHYPLLHGHAGPHASRARHGLS